MRASDLVSLPFFRGSGPVKNISIDKFTGRVNYSKIQRDEKMPNLLAVQLDSYNEFLQTGVQADERETQGMEAVFQTIFPIESTRGNLDHGVHELQDRASPSTASRSARSAA